MIFVKEVARVFVGESAGTAAMSLSPRCYALSQITSLVASISRKNFKTNQAEIEKVRLTVSN